MKKWFVFFTALSMLAAVAAADEICEAGPMWNYGCSTAPAGCYPSSIGPQRWHLVSSQWSACNVNNLAVPQSPIRVPGTLTPGQQFGPLELFYGTINNLKLTNNSHSFKVYVVPNQFYVEIGPNQERFYLEEFHFHVPAEHFVPGIDAVAELHLVHHEPGGETAAIAVMMVRSPNDANNPNLRPIIETIPSTPLCGEGHGETLNLQALVPFREPASFIHYEGSLTTPKCTAVSWYILQTPIPISNSQRIALNIFGGNARPLRNVRSGEHVYIWRRP